MEECSLGRLILPELTCSSNAGFDAQAPLGEYDLDMELPYERYIGNCLMDIAGRP